jgi:excisionase family DNA binding protein
VLGDLHAWKRTMFDDGSAELVRILIASAGEPATGHAVMVLASETQLTPAEAAELLGLSRPFVARLLDSDDIPSTHLPDSRHRVVRLTDVLAFQERRERRREGRRQIADAIDEAGLPCRLREVGPPRMFRLRSDGSVVEVDSF